MSLMDTIKNDTNLGWCNIARIFNIVSHRRVGWLGHLAGIPEERVPKRVQFGHMDGSTVSSDGWGVLGKP